MCKYFVTLLLFFSASALAIDTFDATTNILSIDAVVVDGIQYNNVVLRLYGFDVISVGSQETLTPSGTYNLGSTGPAGGIVFYLDESGSHGLEAQPFDFNNGQQLNWEDAITAASSYGAGWHLPSMFDELYKLLSNARVVGGYGSNGGDYWSSTEIDINTAWAMWLPNGYRSNYYKDYKLRVRAVRGF